MCLCGLSDRDRKVAHVELVGVQALMEDVLLSGSHVITDHSPERQATQYNTQVFLANGLQKWPVLCYSEGLPSFERQTRGLSSP